MCGRKGKKQLNLIFLGTFLVSHPGSCFSVFLDLETQAAFVVGIRKKR